MPFPCSIVHDAPWLSVSFARPVRVVSWAVNRPGLVSAQQLLWREVKNRDLPIDVDPVAWLQKELKARDALDAVTMLTSCDIGNYCVADAAIEDVQVKAIVTVGLSNAERIGKRLDWSKEGWGTINLAVIIDQGLREWGASGSDVHRDGGPAQQLFVTLTSRLRRDGRPERVRIV